jgi:RNA polymerase sigma-70 factor, ECF subfamily
MEARDGGPFKAAPAPGAADPAERGDVGLDKLLTLAARGDQSAFTVVYDRLARQAYGLVRRVLRDPAQAEEVVQEVMLEVWRTASRFDPDKGAAVTWVLTIAHRRAVDRVRSQAAAAEREQRVAQAATAVEDVADSVEASLDAELLRRCLEGLTDIQRESITLAYYGGYTYREVAKLLDTALGTVKSRIRDGLARLRECLGVSW